MPLSGRPRLGFVGLGWIGRQRLQVIAESGLADITAIADCDPAALDAAAPFAPGARRCRGLDEVLEAEVDGVVLATPSGGHADEALRALDAGAAVFCQKPLARTGAEAERVVRRARQVDRLLSVDLSYRHLAATAWLSGLVGGGSLGRVYAVDVTFHNAYGPDRDWYYDRARAGGGCVLDLGIHLLDLVAIWTGGTPEVVSASLFADGRPWHEGGPAVEDFAMVQLTAANGGAARLACSWRAPAGCDAVIELTVYGTDGGARIRNVSGSFYDFVGERLQRNRIETCVQPPDAWPGRAAVAWVARLAEGAAFDPAAEDLVGLSRGIDAIYTATAAGRGTAPGLSRAAASSGPSAPRAR